MKTQVLVKTEGDINPYGDAIAGNVKLSNENANSYQNGVIFGKYALALKRVLVSKDIYTNLVEKTRELRLECGPSQDQGPQRRKHGRHESQQLEGDLQRVRCKLNCQN